MQLQAFSEAMQRVEDLAKSTLQRALSNLKTITAATQSGLKTEQELVDAEYEVEKSRIALADASENIRKLRETMQAVEDFAKQAAGEETADPAQPIEAEPFEPVKPEQPGEAPKER